MRPMARHAARLPRSAAESPMLACEQPTSTTNPQGNIAVEEGGDLVEPFQVRQLPRVRVTAVRLGAVEGREELFVFIRGRDVPTASH